MKKYFLLLVFSAFLFFQCPEITNQDDTRQEVSLGKMALNLDISSAPSDVVALEGILFNSDGIL